MKKKHKKRSGLGDLVVTESNTVTPTKPQTLNDGGSGIRRALNNIAALFTSRNMRETMLDPVIGVVVWTVAVTVPHAMGINMTGWRTPITGLVASALVGAITKRGGIVAGGVGASFLSFTYAKLNGWAIKPIAGVYMPTFAPQSIQHELAANTAISDEGLNIGAGEQSGGTNLTLPNGKRVVTYQNDPYYKASLNDAAAASPQYKSRSHARLAARMAR